MSVKKKDLSRQIHPDLVVVQKMVYEPSGLLLNSFQLEEESGEYGASEFKLNNLRIKFRVAKITPTKVGQFVTLWKRIGEGPIQPFDLEDPFDLFVISVRTSQHFGQFVFPKNILAEKGILSRQGKEGKRAIRVYPPWDITDNKQAIKTQKWQLPYFFEVSFKEQIGNSLIQKLFLETGF